MKRLDDSYGRQLFIGQLVAYIRNGMVKRGIISAVATKGETKVSIKGSDGSLTIVTDTDTIMIL